MKLYKLQIFIFSGLLMLACNDKVRGLALKTPPKFSQDEAEYEIINSTLEQIIPKNAILKTKRTLDKIYKAPNQIAKKKHENADESKMTILFFERLLVADTQQIQLFIKKGANILLKQIDRTKIQPKVINVSRIFGFQSIEIPRTYPLTTSEFNHHIGTVIYSRIVFSENKKQAAFIVHFQPWQDKTDALFCAIEVANKNGEWIITSRTCVDHSLLILYE